MNLSANNIESYLLQYAEGELSSSQREQVEQYLALHPEARELLELYDPALTLQPQGSEVFQEKQSLRKKAPLLPVSLRWMAAACLLAALAVGGLRWGTPRVDGPYVAQENPPRQCVVPSADSPADRLPEVASFPRESFPQKEQPVEETVVAEVPVMPIEVDFLVEYIPCDTLFECQNLITYLPYGAREEDNLITYLDSPQEASCSSLVKQSVRLLDELDEQDLSMQGWSWMKNLRIQGYLLARLYDNKLND